MNELTRQQIARQDYVDNSIFQLVNSLVPDEYRRPLYTDGSFDAVDYTPVIEWDIEWISELREHIENTLKWKLGISRPASGTETPEEDAAETAFEMAFYPFTYNEQRTTNNEQSV